MKKNKIVSCFAIALCLIVVSVFLCSCGKHKHEIGENWEMDNTSHWHACVDCDYKEDEGGHVGEWVIVKEPTKTKQGLKQRTCSVCKLMQNVLFSFSGAYDYEENSEINFSSADLTKNWLEKTDFDLCFTIKPNLKDSYFLFDGSYSAKIDFTMLKYEETAQTDVLTLFQNYNAEETSKTEKSWVGFYGEKENDTTNTIYYFETKEEFEASKLKKASFENGKTYKCLTIKGQADTDYFSYIEEKFEIADDGTGTYTRIEELQINSISKSEFASTYTYEDATLVLTLLLKPNLDEKLSITGTIDFLEDKINKKA